jgi:hypothetical protein
VNVTIPFAINGILLDDGSKVKITNPDGLMVLNLGTNTRLNSETFTSAAIANVNVIKAFSIVPDQTLTTALDNYGKYLCNNMTKLEAIYIKLPPKINNVGASFCHAMFSGCTSLASLPQNFNLPQSINSVGIDFCKIMFSYCTSLKSLPTNFNLPPLLSNVAGDFFSYMFANCTSLQFLPTDFNLPQNIKSDSLDNFCEGMFSGCESLFSLPFDFTIPQSITNVRGYFCRDMFSDCVSLLSLPINFNLPQSLVEVRDMFCANMFQSCTSLESLPFDFTIPQSINLVGGAFCSTMFFACTSLTSNGDARNLDIPNYHTESGSFCDQMFKNSGIINHDTPSPGDQILIKRG